MTAVGCGFSEARVFAMMGGFKEDKVKDEKSPDYGRLTINDWRIEHLPRTHRIERALVYLPNLE